MTRLSVNINKIATLRNARGGNLPDVEKAAVDIQGFGAEGITVHPRPDERHIRYADVRLLRPLVTTEFNIEGNPIPSFVDLVLEVVPEQVTLVPDAHDAITSNAGWNTLKHKDFLTDICRRFREKGIRTSIFIDPDPDMAEGAAACGADRVELYTADYAAEYVLDPDVAVARYLETAKAARPPAAAASGSTPAMTSTSITSAFSSAPSPGPPRSPSAMPSSATPSTWVWSKLFGPILGKSGKNKYICKLLHLLKQK